MKIVRRPLFEPRRPRVVATYDDINCYVGNFFIDNFAELDAKPDSRIISRNDADPLYPSRVRHTVTVFQDDRPMVEYFGVWADEDGHYHLPVGTIDLEQK